MLVTSPQLDAKLPAVIAYVNNKKQQLVQETTDNRIKSTGLMMCLSGLINQLQASFPTANLSMYAGNIHQAFSDFVEADITRGDGHLAAQCLIASSFKELCLFNQVTDDQTEFPPLVIHDYCFDYSESNMLRTSSDKKEKQQLVDFKLLSLVFNNLSIRSVITDPEGKVTNSYDNVFKKLILDTPVRYYNNPKPKLTVTNEYRVYVETPVGIHAVVEYNKLHNFPEIHKEVSYHFYKVLEDNGVTPDALKSAYKKLKDELKDVVDVIGKHHEHPGFDHCDQTYGFPHSYDYAMTPIYSDPFDKQLTMERADRSFSVFSSEHAVYLKSNQYDGAALVYTKVSDTLTYWFKEGRNEPIRYEIDIEKPFLFGNESARDGLIKFELTFLTSVDSYIQAIQRYKATTDQFFQGPPADQT